MKDKQIAPASTEPRIVLVSAVLHCVSMTALVYLRSSFGFGFLRPKSVFFAFSWAFVLYAIYARIDGAAWREHRALIFFGAGAVMLYWIHFLVAFAREWRESGEHEQYSGLPHTIWLIQHRKGARSPAFEQNCSLWGEPAVVLMLAFAMRLAVGEQWLSRWLFVVGVCLWSKEALNRWFQLRWRKRQNDIFMDTEDAVEPPTPTANRGLEPPLAARRARIKRTRNANAPVSDVSIDGD